jgi:hypothetical protein
MYLPLGLGFGSPPLYAGRKHFDPIYCSPHMYHQDGIKFSLHVHFCLTIMTAR